MDARSDPETERILSAAAEVRLRTGSLDVDEVARVAGVSRATVYRKSGGKKALLAALGAADDGDTRATVMAAARRAMMRLGFHRLTIAIVAEEAGVSPVTVHRLFGGREGLFAAIADAGAARRAGAQLALEPSADVAADLVRFATTAVRFVHENRDGLITALDGMRERPELFRDLHGRQTRTAERVAQYLEQQVAARRLPSSLDVKHAAVAFVGMIMTYGFLAPAMQTLPASDPYTPADDDRAAACAAFIVRLFLEGARHG
jgi:AcrR family transcriptional regulator